MQMPSIKKISILGMVLAGASAVTAAVLPKSNPQPNKFEAGILQASTVGNVAQGQTCITGSGGVACVRTVDSSTTEGAGGATTGTSTDGLSGGSSTNVNTTV